MCLGATNPLPLNDTENLDGARSPTGSSEVEETRALDETEEFFIVPVDESSQLNVSIRIHPFSRTTIADWDIAVISGSVFLVGEGIQPDSKTRPEPLDRSGGG